ncbi:alpha/beta hydrolase, partial [Acinetobacter baumannii]|nr:alpha/beta hydrolase [Acinetobacter baumannii]
VTFFGMYLKLDDVSQLEFLNELPRDLALLLEDEEGAFSFECLIFDATEQGVRDLFKHGSFELSDRLS